MTTVKKEKPIIADMTSGQWAFHSSSAVFCGWLMPALRSIEPANHVFAELADKFVGFMDVLADVSDRTTLASATDALRIYEKWLRTGSERDGQRLVERGIIPNPSIGRRFLQCRGAILIIGERK